MIISDNIANIIEKMLDEGGGYAEVKRNDMAARLGCVPSQISYVIMSRFTSERGYLIESKRGGGGCIKIIRVQMNKDEYLMHFFHAIGNSVDEKEAAAYMVNLKDNGIITDREFFLICSCVSSSALDKIPKELRNSVRADILRHIIMTLLS